MTRKARKSNALNIGKKIKIAMLESGFTQTTFAKKLGLTQSAISKLLNGNNGAAADTLQKIAEITGRPVNYFFDNSTDVKGNNNVVGKNIKVAPDVDLQKDVKLLSVQVELLNAKIKLLEEEIKKMKRNNYLYDADNK